jgi:hypothetical protein
MNRGRFSFHAVLTRLLPCVAAAVVVALVALRPADAATSCFGEASTISGTSGNDTLVGTSGKDVIVGLGGKDNITGGGGDDVVCGGSGDDGISAGDGNDRITGDDGYDLIVAGKGDDTVNAGLGNDAVYGGAGVNALDGGTGNDLCVDGASSACEETLGGAGPCPAAFAALIGVWDPSRMTVADPCFSVSGTVTTSVKAESDGDRTYTLSGDDGNSYHVEFLPRDTGRFVRPAQGSRVSLTGVRATDQHGKHEIHPVFREVYKGVTYLSGPRNAGNPSRGYPSPCWLGDGSTCPPWTDAAVSVPSEPPTAGTLTVTPEADAYVASDLPNTNKGLSTVLQVDGSPVIRSYVRFNVQLPAGAHVVQAVLSLYTTSSTTSAGYQVNAVADNSWSETSITYSNAPALGAQIASSGGWSSTGYKDATLPTSAVAAGRNTFGLTTTSTYAKSFNSREGTNKPQLRIGYAF